MRADIIAWAKEKLEEANRRWAYQIEEAEWRSERNHSSLALDYYDRADKSQRDIAMLKAIIAELERLDAGERVG